jgi:serine/threonine-protein kinase HipA
MTSRAGALLDVFLGGEKLGRLERRGPSRYRFTYIDDALRRYGQQAIVLSASLPLGKDAFSPSQTAPFFEGLLPEGSARASLVNSFRLSEEDGFGLLERIGADCAGAVALLPAGADPPQPKVDSAHQLWADELIQLVEDLPRHPLGIDPAKDGVRLSLGGIQPKLVLSDLGTAQGVSGLRGTLTRFSQPRDGLASTCLLKPDFGPYEDLAANEAFCMKVARGVGLRVAETELLQVGKTPCVYVRRFDRVADEYTRVLRIHQEDMCQALGVLPAAKYEENGGPSVVAIVELLRRLKGPYMARDINDFVHAVLVNFLLGNSDAHGKNFALLYEPGTGVRLAPLYDIVCTAVYSEVTDRMAMSIGGVSDPAQVDLGAWQRLAEECGFSRGMPSMVKKRVERVLWSLEAHRGTVSRGGDDPPIVDAIVEVCRKRAEQLTR